MTEFITYLPLLMFPVLAVFLFSGYPVAFVLGGIGLFFGLMGVALDVFNFNEFFLIISRIYGGVVANLILIALPLFVFMGIILEKSGIASELLNTLQHLTRRLPGGLAISVTLLGTIMAATTGIIGASVVMITLMAMPVMLEKKYNVPLASGTIASSGTLGILIPPSIMLVVMGDLLSISVGGLFMTALIPGLMLALLYLIYILIRCKLNPELAPKLTEESGDNKISIWTIILSFLPTVGLIFLVLGSIIGGFATPTEAAGIGAFGALILAFLKGRISFQSLQKMCEKTATTTTMIFGIFIGATAFSYVFRSLGGDDLIIHFAQNFIGGPWIILALLMIITFVLGFFFDWIEITLIVLPLFGPIVSGLDFGGHVPAGQVLPWFAILVALNLQTSFLTPPFGFALFYMKGSAPASVTLQDIYRGVVPFIGLQIIGILLVIIFPVIALWLPGNIQ